MVNFTKRLLGSILFCCIGTVGFCQAPSAPSAYTGKKRLNEIENSNGVISNAIYDDSFLTKEYERYRDDSTRYVSDSLAYNRLMKPVITTPVKPKKSNKKNR